MFHGLAVSIKTMDFQVSILTYYICKYVDLKIQRFKLKRILISDEIDGGFRSQLFIFKSAQVSLNRQDHVENDGEKRFAFESNSD